MKWQSATIKAVVRTAKPIGMKAGCWTTVGRREMADEGVSVKQMRIVENREGVVVVKFTAEGGEIDGYRNGAEHQGRVEREGCAIHGLGFTASRRKEIGGFMTISRVVVCMICLVMVWLSVPLNSPAVDTSLLCPGMADSIWDQWGKGMLPKNADTIIKVLKVASDCPKMAGSMEKIAYDIKAYQEKKAHAAKRLKKRVEAPNSRPCPPTVGWFGSGGSPC